MMDAAVNEIEHNLSNIKAYVDFDAKDADEKAYLKSFKRGVASGYVEAKVDGEYDSYQECQHSRLSIFF